MTPTTTEPPSTNTIPAPTVSALQEESWLFLPSALTQTPSIRASIPASDELLLRAKGISFLQRIAISQKIPVTTCAIASTYFHRFYMHRSLSPSQADGIHHYCVAAAALFLACKTEGTCPKRTRDFVAAVVRIAIKDEEVVVDAQTGEYWKWYDAVLMTEDLLLEVLAFDLECTSPYFSLTVLVDRLGCRESEALRNHAWAFLNDAQSSMACLLFPAKAIAASACWYAARECGIRFPDGKGKGWWEAEGVQWREMVRVCDHMAETFRVLYQRKIIVNEGGCPYLTVGPDLRQETDPTRAGSKGGKEETNGVNHTHAGVSNGEKKLDTSHSQVVNG